jgi:hypothetical protein
MRTFLLVTKVTAWKRWRDWRAAIDRAASLHTHVVDGPGRGLSDAVPRHLLIRGNIMRSTVIRGLFGAMAIAALAACGDDGYDGPPPYNGGGPPVGPTSYIGTSGEFVAWADGYSGNYDYAPIGSYAGKRQLLRGTIDPLSGIDLGQPAGIEIYKYSDGHIYALDLSSYTSPQVTQISSEASATIDDVCSLSGTQVAGANSDYLGEDFVADLVTPTNSSYFYRLPGADGVCDTSDDIIHVVKTGMPASVAPVTVTAMPTAALHDAQGAITGYVAKSGASLLLYDANFANPVTLGSFSAPIGVATVLPVGTTQGYPTGQLYVVDGNIVYVNYAVPSISAPLFTIPNWTTTASHALFAASPTTLYFAVNTAASGSTPASAALYAMPADGSAAAALVLTEPGAIEQMQFPVQASNLVFSTVDAGAYQIFALAQGGSTAVTLATSTQNSGSFTATATAVYYATWSQVSTSTTETRTGTQSAIVGIDGVVIQAPLANSTFASGGELFAWPAPAATVTTQTPYETVFQVQGLTPVTLSDTSNGVTYTIDGVSGGTVVAIDTATNQVVAQLGTIPSGKATFLQAGFRAADHTGFIEATTILSTLDPATRDLYLLNSQSPATLERVTDNL